MNHDIGTNEWLGKLHHVAREQLVELQKLNEHPRSTVINIETITIIGGQMPLDLVALKSALTADTTVQDEMDTVIDAVVAAYSGATSQAEIDAITTQLNSNVTRQQLKVAAAKNLVTPGTGGTGGSGTFAATFSGAQTATAGAAYSGAVTATGGTAPYSFVQDRGALPDGVTFDNGTVSGAPLTAGSFNFGGSATDSAGATAQWDCTVTVS